MPGHRTRARRKASNGFIDIYDWDPIGDLIPRGSPPPSPHHAAIEDAPSPRCERRDFFSQMPFDVILEILGYLRSVDLISMSRTSHLFQGILHGSNETIERIWNHGRRVSWFPRCPKIMSEARWAVLLFRKHCEGCGAAAEQRTDFYIWRHYCKECKLNNCIRRKRILKAYHSLDEADLRLTPYTRIFGRCNKGRRKINDYVLKADIDEVIGQLDFYSEKIKTGTPDASTALAEYKKHRLQLVEEITSRVCRLEKWDYDQDELTRGADSDCSYNSL